MSAQSGPPLTRLSTSILLALADGPLHGYGVLKELEARSEVEKPPKTGSLYVALQRMAEEGLIAEAPEAGEGADRRRRYWAMTDAGRTALREEVRRLRVLMRLAAEKRVAPLEPAPEAS